MAQITPITANGGSASSAWAGGEGNLSIYGTFAGGSVRAEYSFNAGTNWIPMENPDLGELGVTRNKGVNFKLPACDLRVFVVGADTASLSLTANIESL